jgi:hypothetical protein
MQYTAGYIFTRQSCPAILPSSLARQSCPAFLPGSLACPAVLPGSLAQQSCTAVLHGNLIHVKYFQGAVCGGAVLTAPNR